MFPARASSMANSRDRRPPVSSGTLLGTRGCPMSKKYIARQSDEERGVCEDIVNPFARSSRPGGPGELLSGGLPQLLRALLGIRLVISELATSLVSESGRPDSNRRSQAPNACGFARLSHTLISLASSPCGNRTHLSALKGQYPVPIDERASFHEWAGGRSNPRLPGFNRPLDRLSYRPVPRFQRKGPVLRHTGPENPRE